MSRGVWPLVVSAVLLIGGYGATLGGVAETTDDDPDPVPWISTSYYSGVVQQSAAWHIAPAGVSCMAVDVAGQYAAKNCGGTRGGGSLNAEVPFDVAQEAGIGSIIVELSYLPWTGSPYPWAPAVNSLSLSVLCPAVPRGPGGAVMGLDHPCYFSRDGHSNNFLGPTIVGTQVVRVDADHWAEHGYDPDGNWSARVFASATALGTKDGVGVDAGAAHEQTFELYVSRFYHTTAPDGWSAIP